MCMTVGRSEQLSTRMRSPVARVAQCAGPAPCAVALLENVWVRGCEVHGVGAHSEGRKHGGAREADLSGGNETSKAQLAWEKEEGKTAAWRAAREAEEGRAEGKADRWQR